MENKKSLVYEDASQHCRGTSRVIGTSRAREFANHLPHLRRYARALSGSLEIADRYIALTLQNMIESPGDGVAEPNFKIELFRAFTEVWDKQEITLQVAGRSTPVGHLIENLSAKPRQAFLLNFVEGFSLKEVDAILGLAEVEVLDLVSLAKKEMPRIEAETVVFPSDQRCARNGASMRLV